MARKDSNRDKNGRYLPVEKGALDSSWGAQQVQGVAPKAIKNSARALTPIEAYQLSSPVRVAIRARSEPFNQVKIRLFDRRGNEVIDGEEYDFIQHPNPFQSGAEFICNLSALNDLTNERLVHVITEENGKKIARALNGIGMLIMNSKGHKGNGSMGVNPRYPEDILSWRYIHANGEYEEFLADDVVFEHEFNASSPVRGSSPLYTVVNAIDSAYRAERYIRAFFLNGAIPTTLINVETDNPDLVQPYKQEYESAMQGDVNAWRAMFTYGHKVSVEQLSQPIEDAPFQQLIMNVHRQVQSIYLTPPIVSGNFDQVRFDSAAEQTSYFYGGVFLPNSDKLCRYMQKVLEKAYPVTNPQKCKKIDASNIKPSLKKKFQKSLSEAKGDLVIVIDADHIPEVARLKKYKIEYAAQLMHDFHITPRAAALEVDMELDLNDSSDLVWYDSNQKFVEHVRAEQIPITPSSVASDPANVEPKVVAPTPEQSANDYEEVDTEQVDNVKSFMRELRKMSLNAMDNKQIWTLREVDTVAKTHNVEKIVYKEVRKLYVKLNELIKQQDKENIKHIFNSYKNKDYKGMVYVYSK